MQLVYRFIKQRKQTRVWRSYMMYMQILWVQCLWVFFPFSRINVNQGCMCLVHIIHLTSHVVFGQIIEWDEFTGSSTCSLFFRVERASMLHYCWLFSPASPRALCLSASDKSFFNSPLFVQPNWSNCLHSARWLIVFPAPCFRFEMKKREGSGGHFDEEESGKTPSGEGKGRKLEQ